MRLNPFPFSSDIRTGPGPVMCCVMCVCSHLDLSSVVCECTLTGTPEPRLVKSPPVTLRLVNCEKNMTKHFQSTHTYT